MNAWIRLWFETDYCSKQDNQGDSLIEMAVAVAGQ